MIDIAAMRRIYELEEALMLFMALVTGQPEDATEEEKLAAQTRLAELMEGMRLHHR
jgi:hypothetical protein